MPNNYEVSITLSALDNASESIRQTRAELDRLLASADAINTAGSLAESDALITLSGALAGAHADAEAAGLAAAELPGALGAAVDQASVLRDDVRAVAEALDSVTRSVQVIRVRVDVDDPQGVLALARGGSGLSATVRANGGTLPGADPRVHAPGGGR